MNPQIKYLPSSFARASVGAVAFVLMVIGAGMLWGIGAALFVGGLWIATDESLDEVIERITLIRRGDPPK